MAETVLLLAIRKIGIALANGLTNQASAQFVNYATQRTELQGSMGRVVRELHVMHGFLCQMDIRNSNNQAYEDWLEEVRKVVHLIEDMVDEYLHIVDREHDAGCCFYLKKVLTTPRSLLSLRGIASTVKETETNLRHLSQTKDRWVPIVNGRGTTNLSYIVERSQHLASISRSLSEEDLVGVDENRKALEQWLTDDGMGYSVIAMHGMGGLGKTALAANVYRKEREKFDCHAWVSISQTYYREDVLRKLIRELFSDKVSVPSNITTMDITGLEETLKRFLIQYKYLIILDDVWTPETLVDLYGALIRNDKGSRLVITTREGEVAALASEGHILTLCALPKDKAWELFCKKAFPRDKNHECPVELKTLSEEIVSKCKGLPLAIVSVGSLMCVREKNVEEWRRINDQLSWELNNNSRLDHVRNVLHLSFIYLPTYLRSCFLYCSLFPEDCLLKRKKLTRLFIAEGFIEERDGSTMEEVAEGYLKELVHRNMLQLIMRNPFGRMKSFRMHDILRELAVGMCRKECFGVTYEEDKCRGSLEKDGRRLVVHKLKKGINQSFSGIHRLRSVITLDISMPSSTLLSLVAEKCKYMSVLELRGLTIEKVPDAIGDLFNLRHLGLRNSKVKLLPKSIGKLSNLLTLDLGRSSIQELPGGITKLRKLRHLFAEKVNDPYWRNLHSCSGVQIPKGLENLTNLQTLKALEAQGESVRHLQELRELRSLRIWKVKESYCGRLCESLVQMRFLSYLSVNASDEDEVLRLNALPPNLQKLRLTGRLAEGMLDESPLFQAVEQKLYSLDLNWSHLREDPLPSLSRLSNLRDIWFTRAYTGEQLLFLTGWFPKLKILVLRDLHNLKRLQIQEGALVSLEKLTLRNINIMAEVPHGIEFLASLEHLCFMEISPNFLTSLRQSPITQRMRWRHSLRC
jgi:disease resistance protein RPM1